MIRNLLPVFAFALTSLHAPAQEIKINQFAPQGGNGSFTPDGNRVLYEKKGDTKERYYEIHIADFDGKNDTCLSCRSTLIPQRNNGCATMHPSGRWIIFTAEKAEHPGYSFEAIPGLGAYTDIWVMSPDGKKAHRLTDIPADNDHGIIAPRFSADGKKLVWVERKKNAKMLKSDQRLGYWIIRTADFSETPEPALKNIRSFEPGGDAFYETYGFSPDGKRILFCSDMHASHWYLSQAYSIDAETGGDLRQLTNTDYNEHAIYTPDGRQILWMTNKFGTAGTDWWLMNSDGSMKQPLTYFNSPGYPHYRNQAAWAGTGYFSHDGKRFIGGVQTSLLKQEGYIVTLEFLPCGNGNGLKGEYFSNAGFYGDPVVRYEAALALRWLHNQPDTIFHSAAYSARWTGFVEPLYSETYTLYVPNDKNITVWIDDKPVIGAKTKRNKYKEKETTVALSAGKRHKLRVEYHGKKQVDAQVKLSWSSASQYKQVIPMSQLYRD